MSDCNCPEWLEARYCMPDDGERIIAWNGKESFEFRLWWDERGASRKRWNSEITHWHPWPTPPK